METDSVVADGKPDAGEEAKPAPSPSPAPETVAVSESVPESAPAPVSVPVSVPAPGDVLRKAREARGESLNDVVQVLKLSLQQLQALEDGRFDVLPGPTFVRGFLRNYARHLGLDPDPLLAALDGRLDRVADLSMVSNASGDIPVALASKTTQQGSRSALPILLVALVVVLASAIGAGFFLDWFALPFGSAQVSTGAVDTPGTVDSLEGAAAPPESPPAPTTSVSTKENVVVLALPPPVLAGGGGPATEPAGEAERRTGSPADGAPPAAGSAPAPAAPVAPVPERSTLRFTFLANAWVQVRESAGASGKLLFVGTGKGGSSRNVRGVPPFSLTVAKPDKVKLEYNGKPVDLRQHVTGDDGVARLTLQ